MQLLQASGEGNRDRPSELSVRSLRILQRGLIPVWGRLHRARSMDLDHASVYGDMDGIPRGAGEIHRDQDFVLSLPYGNCRLPLDFGPPRSPLPGELGKRLDEAIHLLLHVFLWNSFGRDRGVGLLTGWGRLAPGHRTVEALHLLDRRIDARGLTHLPSSHAFSGLPSSEPWASAKLKILELLAWMTNSN